MTYRAKAYPHPVLSTFSNDFGPEAKFHSEIEASIIGPDSQQVEVTYSIELSSAWMTERIRQGDARLVLDVEGRSTLFREYRDLEPFAGTTTFAPGELQGTVNVTPLVIATRDDQSYRPEGIDDEFGEAIFDIRAGDILGVGDSTSFEIEFARVLERDLVTIRYSSDPDYADTYRFELTGSRIIIIAGESLREPIGHLRTNVNTRPYLFMSIYKDCIAAALNLLAANDQVEETDIPWGRALLNQLDEIGRVVVPGEPEEQEISAQLLVAGRGIRKVDGGNA